MLQLFLGQIPEAVFFGLFMIYAKGLKEKRILFIILMVIEYLLVKYSFTYSWLFHIEYMIITFLTLKILYKEKSQLTDIFIILISYMVVGISSIFIYLFIFFTLNNIIIAVVLHKILLFAIIIFFNKRLKSIQKLYKKIWNRDKKKHYKIKTTTFRAINVIIFNLMFYIINLCMLYATLKRGGVINGPLG